MNIESLKEELNRLRVPIFSQTPLDKMLITAYSFINRKMH